MKVGIISMQRVYNYGSFLQSYALKKTVESLGHRCAFIDFKPGRIIVTAQKSNDILYYLKKIDKRVFKRITHYLFYKKKAKMFNDFLRDYLDIKDYNYDEYCDVAIVGSDEVFNCLQSSYWGLSKMLFGTDINCKKAISYAASFDHTTLEQLRQYEATEEIGGYLKNFAAISVRDNNSCDIVKELTGKTPQINIDPVLLYDFDKEMNDNCGKRNLSNYILIYAYDNRINDPSEINAIKEFAKKTNKKIISAGVFQWWCDNILVNPFELLNYFKNADYVITDTFHGCVMSIKFNKNFCVFIRESNKNKISDLLNDFSINFKQVSHCGELSIALSKKIDYNIINKKIKEEQDLAMLYLNDNLKI